MDVRLFLKDQKIKKENQYYAATSSLLDENGEPLKWEIRPLSAKAVSDIREDCTEMETVNNKVVTRFDSGRYINRLLAESVVFPNLHNAELQDSYGVNKPEDLIVEMVDNPGEHNKFTAYINNMNGLTETLEEKAEKVKN